MEPSAPSVSRSRPRSATIRHLSVYAPLAGLPLLLNPRYKVDDIPSMSQEFYSTDSIDVKFTFDFDKERAIVSAAATRRTNQQKVLQEQQNRFKGTDAILTPEPAPPRQDQPKSTNANKKVDLSEFDHGLPPPDPWEVVRDVTTELSDVILPVRDPALSFPVPQPRASLQDHVAPTPTPIPHIPGGVSVFPVPAPRTMPSSSLAQILSSEFSREAIQRGISLYGEDREKVSSFAKQFDRLSQLGFDAEVVAIACSVNPENQAEAYEFIENFNRLREYGFTDVQIKDALALHKTFEQALHYILS